jgi:hypothetical protein
VILRVWSKYGISMIIVANKPSMFLM